MAEQHPTEGASTSGASASNSDATVELNIKTLDSQIYKFHVDKNMPVSSFKGKIADQVGVPVGQQRLIFRGKVLKDDHLLSEYHVENGDTLHLVERQPTQPQTSSATGSAVVSGNGGTQGNDGSALAPRNRIGQIAHSVVLGTFNVGDQGEGVVSDLTRVIGAVLNSLGVGSQATTNAAGISQNTAPSNSSGPQGSDTDQGRGSTVEQSQAGNQSQFGQPFLSQPFVPFTAASVPPSLNMPIPDSLNTLSEFMTRMEGVLSQNGYQSTPPASMADQPATELPSNARGLPTPEALSSVLRHAERLLGGLAVAALSHIAGRLEQDGGSTDDSVRAQIQTESVQVGLAMQHLGALLLELGRTILTLRMGRSPGEAVVNAGPAVYVSQSGPNPIMVQPFPHQTSPLFSAASVSAPNTANLGSVGIIGNAPRNINIHIHAGTSLAPIVSAVGARAAAGDIAQGERNGPTASDSGATRVFPVRNVITAAVPSRATIAVSPVPNTSQPVGVVSPSQSSDAASLSSAIAEVNSRIRNLLENMRTENETPSGQQENQSVPSSSASDGGNGEGTASQPVSTPAPNSQENQTEREEDASRHLGGEVAENSECNVNEAQKSCEVGDKCTGARDVPLGLGGGLQPKRRSWQSTAQLRSGEGGTSNSPGQSQQVGASGQQVLQTLASLSAGGRMSSNDAAPRQSGQRLGQGVADTEGLGGQPDVTGMMSQVLQSPAFNGLLSGVAQQTGVGSPDVLRNMLQQFAQSPAMRNTLNNLVQQVDTEEIRDVFAGTGSGQDGGLDFSRMIQQMMPVVSQVLGGGPIRNERPRNAIPEQLPQFDDRSFGERDGSMSVISQDGLQEAVRRIALQSTSRDIFSAVVQNAAECSETAERELVDELCGNEDLLNEFLDMLTRDLRHRLEGGLGSAGSS